MDEHGNIWRCNFKEGASDKICNKDVAFESLPLAGWLRLCHRNKISHEACIFDKHVNMANGLKSCVDCFSCRAVGDEGEDFGMRERGFDAFFGG